jgi:hypothetical protein
MNQLEQRASNESGALTDAAAFGFLPTQSGVENLKALQAALDHGGTIIVGKPGTYKLAGTVFIGDNTSLVFAAGVTLMKVAEIKVFTHVILNKGAMTRTFNHNISIIGLHLKVNDVDKWMDEIYGLRGHVSFFYVKDLKIERFRCTDLAKGQFCIQICTFEDVLIDDVIIKGRKDGIHFGNGKRFRVSNGVFQTGDDAIALSAGDWITGNPEFGDLDGGLIENCYELPTERFEGAFAKIVSSAWVDWKPGLPVRHGDAVVSEGKIYRVMAQVDGKIYTSLTRPTFAEGTKELDGFTWQMHQVGAFYTAGVRNVVFRDIYLYSTRVPFQIMSYDCDYAHSYYRGAPMPTQGEIALENINVLSDHKHALVEVTTPCDILTIRNTIFRDNPIVFDQTSDYDSYPPSHLTLANCVFKADGKFTLVKNSCKDKKIILKTACSIEAGRDFSASVDPGPGTIVVSSDLSGLNNI